jgi:hypothetical protein
MMKKFRRQYQTKKKIWMERECVLDHNRHLKRMGQEVKKEVRKGCLKRQDRIERDFEYDGDECAVAGKDSWTD